MKDETCYRCGSADSRRRALVVFGNIKVEKCISRDDCDREIIRPIAEAIRAAAKAKGRR